MLTLADARAAQKLYEKLHHLDTLVRSMQENLKRAGENAKKGNLEAFCLSPIHHVRFGWRSPSSQAHEEYHPDPVNALRIGRVVLKDIKAARHWVVVELHRMGFDATKSKVEA